MVRCAMCDAPATTEYLIHGYGLLSVCEDHFKILHFHDSTIKKIQYTEMQDILKRIIFKLNQNIAKVPLDKTPGQTQYNRGMRNAFKLSIEPVEKELEEIIKHG